MVDMTVVFELPQFIMDGISSGRFERVGGVIRSTGSKRVIAWLTETAAQPARNSGGQASTGALQQILSSQQLMTGLQVANLGVSLVGAIANYRKLLHIEQQIQRVDSKLIRLQSSQDWLDRKHLLQNLAPVMQAVKCLQGVRQIQSHSLSQHLLGDAVIKLGTGDTYFRQVLGQMMVDRFELERPQEFEACYRAWVLAAQGHIQVLSTLDETSAAQCHADTLLQEHKAFSARYLDIRTDVLRKLSAGEDGKRANATLAHLSRQIPGVHDILKGNACQLQYMQDNALKLSTMPLPDPLQARGRVACVCVT